MGAENKNDQDAADAGASIVGHENSNTIGASDSSGINDLESSNPEAQSQIGLYGTERVDSKELSRATLSQGKPVFMANDEGVQHPERPGAGLSPKDQEGLKGSSSLNGKSSAPTMEYDPISNTKKPLPKYSFKNTTFRVKEDSILVKGTQEAVDKTVRVIEELESYEEISATRNCVCLTLILRDFLVI